MSIADQLAELANQGPKKPEKVDLPSRPKGPLGKPTYVPVESINPEGSEVVGAFLTHVLNEQLCSPEDREFAFRTLANATGRKLVVTPFEVIKNFASVAGLVLLTLIVVKATCFPKSNTLYTLFIPWVLGCSSTIMFGLTVMFRRQPDYVIVICCAAAGTMFAIAISSLV